MVRMIREAISPLSVQKRRARVVEMTPFKRFIKVYQKSETIFEESSLGREMYIIHSGKVKLSTKATGREVVLATLGPGEFFGEMALVDAAPRSATATALDDNTRLIILDQAKFLYLVSHQPAFSLTVMHVLCNRIRQTNVLLKTDKGAMRNGDS